MLDLGVFAGLKQVTGPSVEPVTVALARTWLKRGDTHEDTTIGALITAARQQVELDSGLHLPTQTWDYAIDAFPANRAPLVLPVAPLQAVLSLTSYDDADAATEDVVLSAYYVDLFSAWPRLCLDAGQAWPTGRRSHIAGVVRVRTGYAGTALAVSSLTRSGSLVTVTTSAPHGLSSGEVVTIAGAGQADYNGAFDILVTSTTQFTFTVTTAPATPATGTITATPSGVPAWATLAIRMRLAQFSENRDGFSDAEQRVYDWLVGAHRQVWLV